MLGKYSEGTRYCEQCNEELAEAECEICQADFCAECFDQARVEEGGGIKAQGSSQNICMDCSMEVTPLVGALMERYGTLQHKGLEVRSLKELAELQECEAKVSLIQEVLLNGSDKTKQKIIEKENKGIEGEEKEIAIEFYHSFEKTIGKEACQRIIEASKSAANNNGTD